MGETGFNFNPYIHVGKGAYKSQTGDHSEAVYSVRL